MDSNCPPCEIVNRNTGPLNGVNGIFRASTRKSRSGAGFTYVPLSGKAPACFRKRKCKN